MCQAMEELSRKAVRKVREEMTMTLLGFELLSYEKIAEASGLTIEEVKELDAQRTA